MAGVKKIRDGKDGQSLYLVTGTDQGKPAWHYVQVDKLKLPVFVKHAASGTLDVAQYGRVVHSGWGTKPPPDVVERIRSQYGMADDSKGE